MGQRNFESSFQIKTLAIKERRVDIRKLLHWQRIFCQVLDFTDIDTFGLINVSRDQPNGSGLYIAYYKKGRGLRRNLHYRKHGCMFWGVYHEVQQPVGFEGYGIYLWKR